MPRMRPISLNVIPDLDLEARNTAQLVLNAYKTTMVFSHNEKKAFNAAVRAWRERNPNASPEKGPATVASIICHKL
jgi:hypothetical protein